MPDETALKNVLDGARRVLVTQAGVTAGRPVSTDIVIDESDPLALDALRAALTVKSLPGALCMCVGDAALEFLDDHDRALAVVGLHHGVTLRWSGWDGDAVLADGLAVLRWLDERGAHRPMQQREEDEQRREAARQTEAAWTAAIPHALSDLAPRMLEVSQTGMPSADLVDEVRARLWTAVPQATTRTLELLAWYGSGSGRCSGYPAHEELPGHLLKTVPISEIIASLLDPRADRRHDAGAVRHLAGWKSRDKQKQDIDAIPTPLKARLLEQAMTSGDRDKQTRAQRWLSEPSTPNR